MIANNDHQRALKGRVSKEEERMIIVSNIKAVDQAILRWMKTVRFVLPLKRRVFFSMVEIKTMIYIPERPICENGHRLIDGLEIN